MTLKWLDNNQIQVDPPKKPKKITGTRFAAILGLNKWSTPFKTWCEITRTYEEPFEDTIYTLAGKTIEPKQADYMEKVYFMPIVRPEDVYGKDYFKKTYGDFFRDQKIFGGMWDYLETEDNKVTAVLEMKTSKRVEDWETDIPEYYAMQAALYAYLLNVDHVYMVASFLEESDYAHPENYEPSAANTIIREFNVSERYPEFENMIRWAIDFWNRHVVTGISPKYDEKADADILKELRKTAAKTDDDMMEMLKEAEDLKAEIDAYNAGIKNKEKRLKVLQDNIKKFCIEQFRDGDRQAMITGGRYIWTVTRGETEKIDKDRMKTDGVYTKYVTTEPKYTLTSKEIEKEG